MRIYNFNFPGVVLGGEALVVASSEHKAREIVWKEILLHSEVKDKVTGPAGILLEFGMNIPKRSRIIYFYDGDYEHKEK